MTPFSSRAIDRALHAVLVALLRAKVPELSHSPKRINDPSIVPRRDAVVEDVVQRALVVTGSVETAGVVRSAIEDILEDIASIAEVEGEWASFDGKASAFMRAPNSPPSRGMYVTPQSMRDVDPPTHICIRS